LILPTNIVYNQLQTFPEDNEEMSCHVIEENNDDVIVEYNNDVVIEQNDGFIMKMF